MDLERGINLVWDTPFNHTTDDVFTFYVHPEKLDILDINNTVRVHLENFEVQNANGAGIRVANGSKVVANNINVDSCNGDGIEVTDHSTLVITNYDLSLNGENGLLATRNSHVQAASGASVGGNNTLRGMYADWQSGINTCATVPAGDGPANGANATRFAYYEDTAPECWTTSTTTTTSSSTTTTTT
jgi:hypothetical protein